jgi:hypothetical protein
VSSTGGELVSLVLEEWNGETCQMYVKLMPAIACRAFLRTLLELRGVSASVVRQMLLKQRCKPVSVASLIERRNLYDLDQWV